MKAFPLKAINSEKTCTGHGVSPPALWGVPVLWGLCSCSWRPPASPRTSVVQGWALCPPEPLWVSAKLAERRAPLGMLTATCAYRAWRKCLKFPAQELAFVSERTQTSLKIFSSSPHEWSWLIYPRLRVFIWIILIHCAFSCKIASLNAQQRERVWQILCCQPKEQNLCKEMCGMCTISCHSSCQEILDSEELPQEELVQPYQ